MAIIYKDLIADDERAAAGCDQVFIGWLPNAIATGGRLPMVCTWVMIVFGWVAATPVVAGVSQFFQKT